MKAATGQLRCCGAAVRGMLMTASTDVLPVVMPADHVSGPRQGRWTYADYAAIPDDGNRYEVVDGVLFRTPAPGAAHQSTVVSITAVLFTHVELTERGRVLVAPFDVELLPGFVVQPDVLVVLHEHLSVITPTRAVGAPDLVVEVVSPSTVGYDRRTKQDAYARAGVPEYWIADPQARTVEVLQLAAGEYGSAGVFQGQAVVPSRIVPALPVPVAQVFA
jgi:Uma2 family endonuclease